MAWLTSNRASFNRKFQLLQCVHSKRVTHIFSDRLSSIRAAWAVPQSSSLATPRTERRSDNQLNRDIRDNYDWLQRCRHRPSRRESSAEDWPLAKSAFFTRPVRCCHLLFFFIRIFLRSSRYSNRPPVRAERGEPSQDGTDRRWSSFIAREILSVDISKGMFMVARVSDGTAGRNVLVRREIPRSAKAEKFRGTF